MEEKICPTCRGTGQTTRSHGVLIGNERHIETITCITCNGRGRIKNPKRTSSSSSYGKQISGNKSKPTSSGKPSAPLDAAGILALIGFIVGAVVTYQKISDDWIAIGVGGTIVALISYKWYKLIIGVAIITGILYLFATSE